MRLSIRIQGWNHNTSRRDRRGPQQVRHRQIGRHPRRHRHGERVQAAIHPQGGNSIELELP